MELVRSCSAGIRLNLVDQLNRIFILFFHDGRERCLIYSVDRINFNRFRQTMVSASSPASGVSCLASLSGTLLGARG